MIFNEPHLVQILVSVLACFSAGAAGALLCGRSPRFARRVGHGMALLGSSGLLVLSLAGLAGHSFRFEMSTLIPITGVALGMDRLSAFFLLVIAVGAITASIYGIAYTREYEGKYSLAAYGFAFNLFLAAMTLVVLARNGLTFLILWEAMSLASYLLVMTESDRKETLQAGWVYLVMTHAGFACLLVGFLLMGHWTGSMDFARWHALSGTMPGAARHAVFLLLAVGFGSKCGVIPLHIWLPQAHPAAPTPVSALMSGVMIKLGIYGLVRLGFDWMGAGPAWWGGSILIVASISAVLGVLYALVEHDLKRLLAYHSVENIGIILFGVGAGMLFQTYHLPALAALALIAGLYHTLNHAMFKSLLFMGSGAVLQSTHTRNMEEMGGLIRRMPQTAAYFLVGSVAIAALPPFNGFISEWLTFQSLLLSFQIAARGVNLIFLLSVAALALTSGLAAACFIKAFGITFLALPRSRHAEEAQEASAWMRAPMALLSVACLALGVAPLVVLSSLNKTTFELLGVQADVHFSWSRVAANHAFATASPLWIAVILTALLLAIPIGLRIAGANTARRRFETWGCGRALQTARFEYTATAFANPFKRVFSLLYRPVKELEIDFHPESRFFLRTIAYRHEARSIFEDAFYRPLSRLAQSLSRRARMLQSGNVHVYLLYILVTLVVLLLLAR